MSILNVENLTHGFGDKILFKNISFKLLKGEKIGVYANLILGQMLIEN